MLIISPDKKLICFIWRIVILNMRRSYYVKKRISLCISLELVMAIMPISASATSDDTGKSPKYYPCPEGSGKHRMFTICVGRAYGGSMSDPGPELLYGTLNQCNEYYMVVLTEHSPVYNSALGDYVLDNPIQLISLITYIYDAYLISSVGSFINDPILAGCDWLGGLGS